MTNANSDANYQAKFYAATMAVAMIESGMNVGLGTGSTAKIAIRLLGEKMASLSLKISAVPTSERSAAQAQSLNIPLTTIEIVGRLDITIDGADQVEAKSLNLIKGLGGALLREKIVAFASDRYVIIVDEGKIAQSLGDPVAVPVEIIQFGWSSTAKHLESLGCSLKMRKTNDDKLYVTDGGNFIADCLFGAIPEPIELERSINNIAGVVECGLFLNLHPQVIVGCSSGARFLNGEKL